MIEKLRKYEIPKAPEQVHDPEILTEEERFYLRRTGEKKKNYVPVGRRGVFGGVVLNMHLHWKKHETVKVVCRPCRPGQIHEYAQELERLSKGTAIDVKANNTIIFYRGKNYVQPDIMSPPGTLSKQKVMVLDYHIHVHYPYGNMTPGIGNRIHVSASCYKLEKHPINQFPCSSGQNGILNLIGSFAVVLFGNDKLTS